MAQATNQLNRIALLVDKVTPVGNKQRGMRIEADDWNTLVDVALGILQLDRLQEQRSGNLLEERFALKDHEHLGEVSIAWLTPIRKTSSPPCPDTAPRCRRTSAH